MIEQEVNNKQYEVLEKRIPIFQIQFCSAAYHGLTINMVIVRHDFQYR